MRGSLITLETGDIKQEQGIEQRNHSSSSIGRSHMAGRGRQRQAGAGRGRQRQAEAGRGRRRRGKRSLAARHDRMTLLSQFALNVGIYYAAPGGENIYIYICVYDIYIYIYTRAACRCMCYMHVDVCVYVHISLSLSLSLFYSATPYSRRSFECPRRCALAGGSALAPSAWGDLS
jgi:hypothetical protein